MALLTPGPHPKRKRLKRAPREGQHDEQHLRFIRGCQCLSCGLDGGCQSAHIRYSDARHNKVNPGIGQKPDDKHTTPLCEPCHRGQHAFGDERSWWERRGIDPIDVSQRLYGVSSRGRKSALSEADIIDQMRALVREARRRKL